MKIKRSLKDYSAQAISWMAFLLALALVFANFISGSLNRGFFYNSDALYLPSLFRDLFIEHGHITNWFLPQAPCFFPDMLLYFLTRVFVTNFHLAIVFFAVIQMSTFMLGLIWLNRRMSGRQPVVQCALLLVGALFFLQGSKISGNRPELEFFFMTISSTYHFGILLFGIYLVALLMRGLDQEFSRKRLVWSLILPLAILVLSTLTVASDRLFIFQIILPLLPALLFLFLIGRLTWMRLVAFAMPLALAVPLGVALARRMAFMIVRTPDIVFGPAAISQASSGIWSWSAQLIHNYPVLTILWIMFMTGSLLIAMGAIYRASRQESVSRQYLLFFVFCLMSVAINIAAMVFTGYRETRYCLPALIIPTFFGWPLMLGGLRRVTAFMERFWIHHAAALVLAIYLLTLMSAGSPKSRFAALAEWRDFYPDRVKGLDNWARQRNLKYGISDYWNARSITMLSKTDLHLVHVNPSLRPYLWINNRTWYNREFDFIMPGGLDQRQIQSRFGKPKEVFYPGNVPTAMVYDTPQFRMQLKSNPSNAGFR